MFDAAYAFLEEYSELTFTLQYEFRGKIKEDEHSTSLEDMKLSYEFNENYDDEAWERTIPVCDLYRGEYIVCISESGKFFIGEGLWAVDSDNLWNGLLSEYKGGFLHWIDYKEGKKFKRSEYKNKNYIV